MANSLLDFVISLVRDPEAAARYAANPAQAIANAHLTNVTSADVNNLIPVVSDSLSMAAPAGAAAGAPVADHGNVWATGAAAAALDAFSSHTPTPAAQHHGPASGVINPPGSPGSVEVPTNPQPLGTGPHEPSVLLTGAEMADPAFAHGDEFPTEDPAIWDHSVIQPHAAEPNHHGFDIHG
ncbi:hypothetical protein H7H78_12750 [Mycobacterium shinjukuense]|uniref:Uncharacterized protein n=1 Tax=Mycobacterium shinjukuense TaxID=398694 RepID=A0A7I7MUP5_9MYCO|nr:IniB N-terminal domain-containing protein [Mycobacterium shinjukuense]MCV6986269.1 hypothetical protein [Mycobacterium shinjukuense]ORB63052.1 hypothetical protein BST45_18145 [Mycobacterium shinjukuense]BBX75233.1 hypothetical protein MSHI_31390 [Mycobacterium shinjukuense]